MVSAKLQYGARLAAHKGQKETERERETESEEEGKHRWEHTCTYCPATRRRVRGTRAEKKHDSEPSGMVTSCFQKILLGGPKDQWEGRGWTLNSSHKGDQGSWEH